MRYLNKREDFLKKKQHIQGVPYETLLEMTSSAGPFANDVGWNDSLLGRLINHVIRKAKIAAKVPRIKSLISQLKDEFDQIVGQAKVYSLSSEDQQLVIQIELDVFFKELIYAVENNFKVGILKSLTDGCIKRVTDMAEFDKKAVLLEELKKFREFLDQFKDDEGSNDIDDSEEDSTDSTGSSTDTGVTGTGYVTMVKNLKALALILANYTKVSTKASTSAKTGKPISTYITVAGDTLVKIQSDPVKNPKKLDVASIRSKNPGKLDKYKQDNITMAPGITLIMEGTVDTIGTGGAANRGTTVAGEDHLTQAFNKLKKDIEVLISTKEKGIGVDYKFINDIATNSNNTSNKELIKNLYNEINRYLVGDKKATIQEKDKLYTEGIEVLNDKNKTVVIAEKIARFAKRAFQFEKENLYGGLGDLKVPLQTFVTTLREINKLPIVTAKKESLLNYNLFLEAKNILDNQGGQTSTDDTTTKPTTGTTSQTQGKDDKDNVGDVSAKILEFFNKTCIEVRAYTVSEEERKSIQTKIDQVKTEDGKKIEMTIDPIIAIMNLFIKAYKIYTVKTITKRTENVDTNTLSEYTSFGGNEETGRSGPYRNNKLFDMWEEAVNNIRKDRKYQAIFTDNANLRLPKVTDPDPANPEDWTIKPKAGASFRKFINDVLDGDTLYKSAATTGAVATFIEKYFGDGTVSEGKAATDIDSVALAESAETAGEISKNAIKLELKKQTDITPQSYTFFVIEGMRAKDPAKPDVFDESVLRSFLINKTEASKVWLFGTTFLKKFDFDLLEPKHEIDKGDFEKLSNSKSGEFYYTSITVENFKKLKPNQKLKIVTQDTKGALSAEDNIKITNIYTLNKVDDGELYKIPDEGVTKILNTGKTGLKSDVKDAIKDDNKTEIKPV